jgi:hypothetical protein
MPAGPEVGNADSTANALMTSLIAGVDFTLPAVDLTSTNFAIPALDPSITANQPRLTNADLTTKAVGGTGTFDVLMDSLLVHLKTEYDKGRISGDQYSKAYVELTNGAMQNSVQFLLQRDQSYWNAVTAQYQAQLAIAAFVKAKVDLETAKVQLQAVRMEAQKNAAEYALTKLKLSTEGAQFLAADYSYSNLLPIQKTLLQEQVEGARAQTIDTRSDGSAITGVLGKQKDLYSQQITSYKRDAEMKGIKMFTDAWITQKTIDEGLIPPLQFNNTSLDSLLGQLKTNLGFVDAH